MDNPNITSELIREINHIRKRHRLRMYLTQVVIIMITWLIVQFFNSIPNYKFQLLNRDKVINNQNIERLEQLQEYKTGADINKVNKLSDIADV